MGCLTIKTGHLRFDQLFPEIQRLELLSISNIDVSSISFEFEHLKHSQLTVHNLRNKQYVFGLISKNVQITSFSIDEFSQVFCDFIKDHMPNLQNLTVSCFDVEKSTTFDQVKHLKIDRWPGHFAKLSFPQLQSLETQYLDKIPTEWTEFIKKHQSVTHLKLTDAYEDSSRMSSSLREITGKFTNLTKFTYELPRKSLRVHVIVHLIESNVKLEKLEFISCHLTTNQIDELQPKFGIDWDIVVKRVNHEIADIHRMNFILFIVSYYI